MRGRRVLLWSFWVTVVRLTDKRHDRARSRYRATQTERNENEKTEDFTCEQMSGLPAKFLDPSARSMARGLSAAWRRRWRRLFNAIDVPQKHRRSEDDVPWSTSITLKSLLLWYYYRTTATTTTTMMITINDDKWVLQLLVRARVCNPVWINRL